MTTNTALINVCALPPEPVAKSCVELSQRLTVNDTLLTLGSGRFAHLTLYLARLPRSAVEDAVARVGELMQTADPIALRHTGWFVTGGNYVEASYEATPELRALHERVIDALAPLRWSPSEPQEESYFAPYTDEQRRNVLATGYDLAHELFRPHITISRVAAHVPKEAVERQSSAVLPSPDGLNLSFTLGTITVYEADENGAVHTRLAAYP